MDADTPRCAAIRERPIECKTLEIIGGKVVLVEQDRIMTRANRPLQGGLRDEEDVFVRVFDNRSRQDVLEQLV